MDNEESVWPEAMWEKIDGNWYCSHCGQKCLEFVLGTPRWSFCPMCGSFCKNGLTAESI